MPIRWYGPANPEDPTYRHFNRIVNLVLHAMVFAALVLGAGLALEASAAAANTAPLPPGPWTKTLGPNAPEPTVADLFRLWTLPAPFGEPTLREWLADVTHGPRKFTVFPPTGVTTITGPSRLVPPLPAGAALGMPETGRGGR